MNQANTSAHSAASLEAQPPRMMRYARARLWLGMANVGAMTFLAVVMLMFQLPYRLFPITSLVGQLGQLLGFVLFYSLVQGAFDMFGGYILPREYGRNRNTFASFMWRWLRGAGLHALILWSCGALLLSVGRVLGVFGILAFVLLLVGLVAWQAPLAAMIGSFRYKALDHAMDDDEGDQDPKVLVAHVAAPYFNGGIAGLPDRLGLEPAIIIPQGWLARFSADDLDILLARREEIISKDLRERGLLLALIWQLLGFTIALVLPGTSLNSVAGIVSLSCWSTLWSFVGVLVLPTWSRWGTLAADSYVAPEDEQRFAELVAELDADQDEELEPSTLANHIFHPLADLDTRLAHIGSKGLRYRGRGFWQVARTNLYLSWASLGLLSRAVHCNIGRPEVWVLLPTD